MKIAVLMSTYNGDKYLNRQLESIANQTMAGNIVLYIRDDGSTDSTFKIIDKWKDKIDIILYKGKNAGPAMSFWKLLMNPEITADYYAFCDQDDLWDTDKLEKGVEKLRGNRYLYICNCRIVDENDKIIKKKRVCKKPDMNVQQLFVSGCVQGCSMIFTNALCEYLRKLDIRCVPMHDIVLMLYAKYLGEIYWDDNPHFGYRVHSDNVVEKSNKSVFKQIKTIIWNWENSKKNSMSKVATEMLNNISYMPTKDRQFLEYVSEYKKHRIWLIKNAGKWNMSPGAIRSYKIRILIGKY